MRVLPHLAVWILVFVVIDGSSDGELDRETMELQPERVALSQKLRDLALAQESADLETRRVLKENLARSNEETRVALEEVRRLQAEIAALKVTGEKENSVRGDPPRGPQRAGSTGNAFYGEEIRAGPRSALCAGKSPPWWCSTLGEDLNALEPSTAASSTTSTEPEARERRLKEKWDWGQVEKRRAMAVDAAKSDRMAKARVSDLGVAFDGQDFGTEAGACVGLWEPWSKCSAQCNQKRAFHVLAGKQNDSSLALKEECEKAEMPFEGEKDFRNCMNDECPLSETKLFGVSTQSMLRMKDFLLLFTYPVFFVASVCVLAVGVLNRLNLVWMPDAGVIILLSMTCALFLRFTALQGVHYGDWADEVLHTLVAPVMNLILLPLSVFEGAYNTQRKNFWSQFPYSCVFAVFGTLFSAFLLAFFIVQTGPNGADWHPIGGDTDAPYREALCYSAFIADLDPVATLASFGKLKVDALLSTLVAGEATLNDPVAIVMFGILNEKAYSPKGMGASFLDGFLLLGMSMLLGVLGGFGLTLLQRLTKLRGNDVVETLFLFTSAYVLFAIGELSGYSGIIVDLFGGIVMGIYSRDNVNASQRDFVLHALNTGARLCDMGIFMIVGFSAFTVRPWGRPDEFGENPRAGEGIKFGLITIVLCLVVRLITTAFLVGLCNLHKHFTSQPLIPTGTAVMIWHSQLRGGLTLMMALMIDPMWTPNKPVLVDGTIVVCIGMCFLIGCTCPGMLAACGVPMGVPQEDGTLSTKTRKWLGKVDWCLRFALCHGEPETKEPRDSSFYIAFYAQRTTNLMTQEPFLDPLAESSDDPDEQRDDPDEQR